MDVAAIRRVEQRAKDIERGELKANHAKKDRVQAKTGKHRRAEAVHIALLAVHQSKFNMLCKVLLKKTFFIFQKFTQN